MVIILHVTRHLQMGLPAAPPYVDPVTQKAYLFDLTTGQIMELRVPTTVVERLTAQQILGIGLTVSSQGRKATNSAPPRTETKGDTPGGRQTLTTSDK